MNFTRDLHLCGTCKKIFSDLNFFLEHKSQCPSLQNSVVFSPNPHDISLENGLFCNETVLDLTVLDSGSFLPILHCENEEVVSDAAEFQPQEEIFQSSSSEKTQDCLESLTSDQLSKNINEKDVVNLLANQLSTETVNNSAAHHRTFGTQEKCARKSLNSEYKSKNGNSEVENEQQEENYGEKTAANQSQKNICKICNFVSAYHKDLVRHMRKHTGERPYSCSVCDKKFARQDKLSSHKRIHVGDKRYKCQLCEYATTDSGALKKHSRIHTDERPHRCQMCSYRARNASHMTVHLRTHTGDSPFFCQFENCEKTFKTSTDLKRHLKVHKLDSLSPSYSSFDGGTDKYSCKHVPKNGKLFVKSPGCLFCQDLTYKDAVKRKRGSGRKGGALALCVQPHKCSLCTASFVRQDSLRSHLKLHHLNTRLAQDVPHSDELFKEVNSSFAHIVPGDLGLPHNAADKLRRFFFGDRDIEWATVSEYLDYYGDISFHLSIDEAVHAHLASGKAPVYCYRLSYDGGQGLLSLLLRNLYPQCEVRGVCHADIVGYMFKSNIPGAPEVTPGTADQLVVSAITGLWRQFASSGNPNKEGQEVVWEPAVLKNSSWRKFLEINQPLEMKNSRLEQTRMEFWDSLLRPDTK